MRFHEFSSRFYGLEWFSNGLEAFAEAKQVRQNSDGVIRLVRSNQIGDPSGLGM